MMRSQFSAIKIWVTRRLKRYELLNLSALVLALAIVLGSISPLQSQTALPYQDCAVPQVMCVDIKQLAQEDVVDDIPRRTAHAIELFKERHPDWKINPSKVKLEISRIYDQEYSKQEKIKKKDFNAFWEKITENGFVVPLTIAILAILGAWFREAIGKKINVLAKAIDDWVYSRFAGTPMFERVALWRYREALVETYRQLKIPFRTNHTPLEMSEIYVPLKVAGSSESEQVDAYGAIAQYRRLMVTGIPGSGKTMLLRHVVLSYGKGHLNGLENRPVPILLELHRLRDLELTEEKLITEIVEAFKRNQFPNADRFVRHSLQSGKLMLLLDGLDEVNDRVRPVLVQRISDLLKSCRLIVTCRTAVYKNEFANETDQTLEVLEFTDQQMRRFLDAWRREIPAGKSIDQLLQTLRDRPQIMALARNPLLLTIIVHLYTEPSFELPRSRTEFYDKLTRILLEQWQDQFNQYRGGDKRRALKNLALYQQRTSTDTQSDRRSIDYLDVLEQIRQLLPSLNLDPEQAAVPLLNELVERSGLFLKIDGGDRYQFAHLTLQEYFAALALVDQPNELMRLFKQDPNAWREVVKIWCGLAGDSTTLITEVYQQDQILGFECLEDAQEVQQYTADLIINYFKELLSAEQIGQDQDEITRAFGTVAASNRPRGKAVFQFLVETLTNHPNEVCRTLAANALSLTNLPEAAEVLSALYRNFLIDSQGISEVRQPLIRMGDLAVPYLQKYSYEGFILALDDLWEIGTPDAAEAIVPSIWSEQPEARTIRGIAAIHLANLLTRPEIEERLRGYKLSDAQRKVKQLDWVWQPFAEPLDSALPLLTGRIAYLLTQIDASEISAASLRLDPRLVIPVCSIEIHDQAPSFGHESSQEWVKRLEERIDGVLIGENDSSDIELYSSQLKQQAQQLMDFNLEDAQASTLWRLLVTGLSIKLQLSLILKLLAATHPPTHDNWRNIFQSVKYDFRRSQQYRMILLIAAFLSLFAILGIFYTASITPPSAITGLLGFAVLVIGVFWRVLSKGSVEPWEPTLFAKFGVRGLRTYAIELNQLFRNDIVWSGIEVLSKLFIITSSLSFADVVAYVIAIAVVMTVVARVASVFVSVVVAIVFASAVFVFVAVASVVSVFVIDGFASIAFVAVFVFIAVIFAVAGSGYTVGTVGILSGIGLGCWYYFKDEPNQQWWKFFTVLVLPWFCTAPIVLGFAYVAFTFLFGHLMFLPLKPWLCALLLELCLVGLGSYLWRWGQRREAMARNPLQGGLIEAMLRAKYGR
jgi:hypothetical protein